MINIFITILKNKNSFRDINFVKMVKRKPRVDVSHQFHKHLSN